MHFISYTSTRTGPADELESDLKSICASAKSKNPKLDISGVLFHHQRKFLQLIEGPKKNLDLLMKIISADPRHKDVKIIIDRETNARSFPDWNMDTFNLDLQQNLDPEILAECATLFNSTPEADAEHFVQALRIVLHCSQLDAMSA